MRDKKTAVDLVCLAAACWTAPCTTALPCTKSTEYCTKDCKVLLLTQPAEVGREQCTLAPSGREKRTLRPSGREECTLAPSGRGLNFPMHNYGPLDFPAHLRPAWISPLLNTYATQQHPDLYEVPPTSRRNLHQIGRRNSLSENIPKHSCAEAAPHYIHTASRLPHKQLRPAGKSLH